MVIKKTNFKAKSDPSNQSPTKQSETDQESIILDNILRPADFANYFGQTEVKANLQVFLAAANKRDQPLEHTLLYGPPGLGKTTLAMILAGEMKANLRLTSGPALEKPGDLAAILSNLQLHDFLFIDEIHRLRRPVEEILYSAMEDFAIDLVVGKGPSARNMRLAVPRFTLVGATTRLSMISGPLRDRFGHTEKLRYYEPSELTAIIQNSAKKLEIEIDPVATKQVASISRATPRIANRLLRRMRDFAEVLHQGKITNEVVTSGMQRLSIDKQGLDYADQQYLRALCEKFNGGPAGIETLSAVIGEESDTIAEVIEPFLLRQGLITKSPRGRLATPQAFAHLQITPPANHQPSLL